MEKGDSIVSKDTSNVSISGWEEVAHANVWGLILSLPQNSGIGSIKLSCAISYWKKW